MSYREEHRDEPLTFTRWEVLRAGWGVHREDALAALVTMISLAVTAAAAVGFHAAVKNGDTGGLLAVAPLIIWIATFVLRDVYADGLRALRGETERDEDMLP